MKRIVAQGRLELRFRNSEFGIRNAECGSFLYLYLYLYPLANGKLPQRLDVLLDGGETGVHGVKG